MHASEKYISESDIQCCWQRFKQGDIDAFEYLYREYFEDLYKYGMTILNHDSIVKDAIQQLFEDLWKYRSNLSNAKTPNFYLLKALRNLLYKHFEESKKFTEFVPQHLQFESLPSNETLIINSDDEQQLSGKMRMLINDLPPRQREAIMLIFFEEYSYEEVSNLLSMSVQSVYTLVWRSLSTLRVNYKFN